MKYLSGEETKAKITDYARKGEPFLFAIDFQMTHGFVIKPDNAAREGFFYSINGKTNSESPVTPRPDIRFELFPVSLETYRQSYDKVMFHLKRGDTYLLNLTFPTRIRTSLSLEEAFLYSNAIYKLFYRDSFLVFSPEIFVRIKNGIISSFPMKGTIDASIPDAEAQILENDKESFEHNTIVDLIRNDLAMVSTGVKVKRFRYTDRIHTNKGELLQISSEITGNLPADWRNRLGEILFTLLPAGSVTGAPKDKTVRIIRRSEIYDRGFYTGICGYFDGRELDSGVMIRFIEKTPDGLIFKSGGGITALSDLQSEYEEMIQKVYVPVV
jgi:para-aminobenzoate synthetase component I